MGDVSTGISAINGCRFNRDSAINGCRFKRDTAINGLSLKRYMCIHGFSSKTKARRLHVFASLVTLHYARRHTSAG